MARPRSYPAGIVPGLARRYRFSSSHQLMHASRSSDSAGDAGFGGKMSGASAGAVVTASKHQTRAPPAYDTILELPWNRIAPSLAKAAHRFSSSTYRPGEIGNLNYCPLSVTTTAPSRTLDSSDAKQ